MRRRRKQPKAPTKLSSATRQEVPEGEEPEDLPEPRGLQGVSRRPMPISRLGSTFAADVGDTFTALGATVMREAESSGALDLMAVEAEEFIRNGGGKAAVGRGGRPLDPKNAARISRLFQRDSVVFFSDIVTDALGAWEIQGGTVFADQYEKLYNAGGRAAQQKIGIKPNFNLRNPAVLTTLRERANLLTGGIRQDTFDRLRTVVAKDFFFDGKGPDQVAKSLTNEFKWLKQTRAKTIARTETLAVTSQAQHTVYAASGIEFKRWLTTLDGNERETHFEAHAQLKKIDQPFDVGGSQLMYPGDPGGDPSETINCRCDHIPVILGAQQVAESTVWSGNVAPAEFAARAA
jgi:hypothetical protein